MKVEESSSNSKPNGTGARRIIKAFGCSMLGFKACFQHEAAFRQELILCIVLLPLSLFISTTLAIWVGLIAAMLFLLFAEIINSAIEALADQVSLEHHELLGRAKDLGSAGVFLAFILNCLVWGYALYQYWLV